MPRVVRHFTEVPRPCSYLPDEKASLEYQLLTHVLPSDFDAMLSRGWRRFGPAYFRPACADCTACVSLRLDVDSFTPTTSQSRAFRRSKRFRVVVGPIRASAQKVKLHQAWHGTREDARGWEPSELTLEAYETQFAFPSSTGRELAFYDADRLVAVSLIDVTPTAVSAAYFFFAPDIARLSPGVANVMWCVDLARRWGKDFVYLGYRVEGCASLVYKARFGPHALLRQRPGADESPKWLPVSHKPLK